jgi:hypothetical protein
VTLATFPDATKLEEETIAFNYRDRAQAFADWFNDKAELLPEDAKNDRWKETLQNVMSTVQLLKQLLKW